MTTLLALSPLDGRYAAKLDALRPHLSEFALIRSRVLVEVEWLRALADAGLPELPRISQGLANDLGKLVTEFSADDAERVKAIERTTNHDVKAVEYFLKERLAGNAEFDRVSEFIHFACTSEDINNLSYALMLRDARDRALLPKLDGIVSVLRGMAHRHLVAGAARPT